jgi:RNA polymerase sigma-70 factor (ECF subfamily)
MQSHPAKDKMPLSCQTDAELVRLTQKGNQQAFARLYYLHQNRVRTILRGSLRGDVADDLQQMTFIKAYQAIGQFRGEAEFSTWLTRIALNLCRSHFRQQKTQKHFYDNLQAFEPHPVATPEKVAEDHDIRRILIGLLRQLPRYQQRAMWLRFVRDLSYSEIGARLKVSEGTIKTWIYRGRLQMVQKLRTSDFQSF